MSADPETLVKYYTKLDQSMGKLNTVISGLTRVIDKNIRAQTKVVAMASKTKGMMLGVVADLDLMGGAFGKVKKALANIFLPMDKDTPKLLKLGSGLITLSGAFENILSPMWNLIKGSKDRVKALQEETAVQNEIAASDIAVAKSRSILNKESELSEALAKKQDTELNLQRVIPQLGLAGRVSWQPKKGKAPGELMGLDALPQKPGLWKDIKGASKEIAAMGSSGMKKGMKMWKKNVTTPIKQIASGGIGLGFQSTIIMGLMQAFSSLFTIFQPVIDVVGSLVERVSVGFMPLIEMLMEILTSPPVLAMVDMLAQVLAEVFEMFRPLVPIIIELIQMAMIPLMNIMEGIMPIIKIIADLIGTLLIAFMPLIDMLLGVLGPVIEWLVKILLLLVVLGMYPLVAAIYVVGLGIAALIDLFTLGAAGAIRSWNNLMLPIFGALNVATGAVIDTFQTGTDYVPETGIYMLHRGERVVTPEDNRGYSGGGGGQSIVINMYGSYLGADMEDLTNRIAKKLSLHRY